MRTLAALTLIMASALPAAAQDKSYDVRKPAGNWQVPGEIKQPTGMWQVPGDIQAPKGIQAVKTVAVSNASAA